VIHVGDKSSTSANHVEYHHLLASASHAAGKKPASASHAGGKSPVTTSHNGNRSIASANHIIDP
jgi:hypothetical protein